jgi:hypothetical protein
MAEQWFQKNLSGILFPLGGAVLSILVVPAAIAQYPQFFNENTWLLPVSVGVVLFCFCVPVLADKRMLRLYSALWQKGKLGKALLVFISVVAIGILYFATGWLFEMHKNHLVAMNRAQAAPVSPVAPTPQPAVPTAPSNPRVKQSPVAAKRAVAASPEEQDELLVGAKRELKNCQRFLGSSENRRNSPYGGIAGQVGEKKDRLNDVPSALPNGRTDILRKKIQSQIDALESRFSSAEAKKWNDTYGPEFGIVFREIVESEAVPEEIDHWEKIPDSIGQITAQCRYLGQLLPGYEAKISTKVKQQ